MKEDLIAGQTNNQPINSDTNGSTTDTYENNPVIPRDEESSYTAKNDPATIPNGGGNQITTETKPKTDIIE